MKIKKTFIFIFIFLLIITSLFYANYLNLLDFPSFNINKIEINELKNIDHEEIKKILSKYTGKNILFLDIWKIRNEIIKQYKLIDDMEIIKKYPSELNIKIYEKKPIALLIKDEKYNIIDSNLNLTNIEKEFLDDKIFLNNLIYFEANNIEGGNDIMEDIKNFLNFKENKYKIKINSAYYIGSRRWDIIVDRKIKIMLPEKINENLIDRAFKLVESFKIKGEINDSSLYTILDLRIKDKVFIKNINY